MIVLFTDTDTDITPKEARELGYNLISMPYMIDDRMYYPYRESDSFDFHQFYDLLRNGTMPKTCAISPQEYCEYFEPFFKAGHDILYVHFSEAMSGTFNAMHIAYQDLLERYPDRKLYTIDTKGITILSNLIVKEVANLFKSGKSIDEILNWAKEEVDHYAVYFYADDLSFFKRSGRVTGFAAFMGNIIGLHPIINMGEDGKMKSISKARGKKNTLNKIMQYVEELQVDIDKHKIIIGHSDALETAEEFAGMLKDKFGANLDIEFVPVNPTAGSHCGPSNIGVAFYAKHR